MRLIEVPDDGRTIAIPVDKVQQVIVHPLEADGPWELRLVASERCYRLLRTSDEAAVLAAFQAFGAALLDDTVPIVHTSRTLGTAIDGLIEATP